MLEHPGYPKTQICDDGSVTTWTSPGCGYIVDADGNETAAFCCPYIPLIPGFTVPKDWDGPDHIDTTKETIEQFEQRVAFEQAQKVVNNNEDF